ncbi:MAG: AAA family ATPase [Anaerolineae bacterium]|nr:AAA family ATPase [Anaerolineae bacterium]
MVEPTPTSNKPGWWELESVGPATLAQVMAEVEQQVARGEVARFQPLATGFDPLDDVLNGGLRRGDLMIVGGPYGVGKTIFALQIARNVVHNDERSSAIYVCYEHDRAHLMSRLLCLESAEENSKGEVLTLRRLAELALGTPNGVGLISRLRRMPRYAAIVDMMTSYSNRLALVKASGDTSTLDQIRQWVQEMAAVGPQRLLLVVDYLQKIPVDMATLQPETEVTTFLTQGLKELAMSMGIQVIAIAASDRPGLKAKRMRLADLRGSSALQYEADVGLVLNNKHDIVSREHMIYNPSQAETMRSWVVMSVEKNRAGRNALDMEYLLDAAHFRMATTGGFVRERLVDEKVILE